LPKISASSSLQLIVDGRVDYSAALKLTGLTDRVPLRVYPNPKRGPKGRPRSPAAISRDLFPVDALHQLIRHSNAEHKRETIAFGRRLESIVGRAHLMAIWKNFIKSRSERRPDRTTPAMKLGLTDTRWRWERIFARRLFTKRLRLSESTIKLYWKQLSTHLPALDRKHAA
jgi:hypothetical protein